MLRDIYFYNPQSVGRDPCTAAGAFVGPVNLLIPRKPGVGTRRGSGEPPCEMYPKLEKLSGIRPVA